MSTFTAFQPHTILTAAELNAAFSAVDADASAAASSAATAQAAATAAGTQAAAAGVQAASALAAAQAASSAAGTVKSVNGVAPDANGNVVVATSSSSSSGSRPAISLFTDSISAVQQAQSAGWIDDGTSYVLTAPPVQTNGSSSAAVVYAGKPCPAYDASTNTRTLTVEIDSSLYEADGLKIGIALHDPAGPTLYTVALGLDLNSIPNSVSSYYRPSGIVVQKVALSGSSGGGTRAGSNVFSLPHAGKIWLRLVDTQGSGVTGGFSRDGVLWIPLPTTLTYGSAPSSPTWGPFADVGLNQGGDWGGALGFPATLAARILSFVES